MNKNIIISLLILLILGGGLYLFMTRDSVTNSETLMEDSAGEPTAAQEDRIMQTEDESAIENPQTQTMELRVDDGTAMNEGTVKEFTVVAKPFSFSPAEIRVNKGDTVRITLENQQGMHDWVVDEFNARTKVINTGETDTIEFVADQSGTFEYYCSVMNHRAQGMVGNLIVE